MKLMSDQEHNRRVGEIRAERNRQEEQEFREVGLFGRPLTAEERATRSAEDGTSGKAKGYPNFIAGGSEFYAGFAPVRPSPPANPLMKLVGAGGIEPPTPRMARPCSNPEKRRNRALRVFDRAAPSTACPQRVRIADGSG